jgi:hypothetical protein
MKIGLITNPRSKRNRRGFGDIDAFVLSAPEFLHVTMNSIDDLPACLADFAARDVGLIAINGGDGTVQAILTALYEKRPFARLPKLAILPRGTTNMSAGDIGVTTASVDGPRRLLQLARAGQLDDHVVQRPLLRVENIAGLPPQRGLFFGTAGIVEAIEHCRARFQPLGLGEPVSNALTLVNLCLGLFWNSGRSGMIAGSPLAITLDGNGRGGGTHDGHRLIVLATTLDRLVLGTRPFWNTGRKPIHFTSIAHPPRGFARRVGSVLYGGVERTLPEDVYFSRDSDRVELEMTCRLTLDGELFHPETGKPVIITADDQAEFVRV